MKLSLVYLSLFLTAAHNCLCLTETLEKELIGKSKEAIGTELSPLMQAILDDKASIVQINCLPEINYNGNSRELGGYRDLIRKQLLKKAPSGRFIAIDLPDSCSLITKICGLRFREELLMEEATQTSDNLLT